MAPTESARCSIAKCTRKSRRSCGLCGDPICDFHTRVGATCYVCPDCLLPAYDRQHAAMFLLLMAILGSSFSYGKSAWGKKIQWFGVTDASPWGFGGSLYVRGATAAWFEVEISKNYLATFSTTEKTLPSKPSGSGSPSSWRWTSGFLC